MAGRIRAPQRCAWPHLQNLWTCYLTWWKKLCSCSSVKDLEMGWFLGFPNLITWVLIRKREEDQSQRFEDAVLVTFKVEEGAWSPRRQAACRSWKMQGSRSLPESFSKEFGLADTLVLVQKDPFGISDLHNCKKLNVCYFRPLSLWLFVIATIGNKYKYLVLCHP